MDRQKVYAGQEVLETDLLYTNKFSYEGLAKLAETLMGQSQAASGFACTPGTGLNISIDRGAMYDFQALDATAYSTLLADSHTVLKQGLLRDAATLSVPAPGAAGQSITYLVEVQLVESDANSIVLPYYNSSNPTVPYNGPANSGSADTTTRTDVASVRVKAGTAATTGTQVAPAPDAGWYPLWNVTIANGQASVSAAAILPALNSILLTYNVSQIGLPANALAFARGQMI